MLRSPYKGHAPAKLSPRRLLFARPQWRLGPAPIYLALALLALPGILGLLLALWPYIYRGTVNQAPPGKAASTIGSSQEEPQPQAAPRKPPRRSNWM